ncbi:potassium channel subfamily K member 18 isoform X2 [Coccinella septempunctata]|uniref:potassium channel subfamily K member 18 isoform X2 n=1 Tax=Coccinella septempunctata TaxID=41139 RepID=UPI001D077F64|nr:potassium channel subfamily K member 18 isoform X2 [Coccinella septempunctata]
MQGILQVADRVSLQQRRYYRPGGYTMGGALMFRALEKDYHLQVKTDVSNAEKAIVVEIWNQTLSMNPFTEEEYRKMLETELMKFQKSIVLSVRRGYDGSKLSYSEQWSIAGAFLYSLTVITTIGYGNITPHTMGGQIMTIFYAIIGMPLFLLYLSNIGDIMAKSFKWIYANVCLCRWCPGVASRRAERKRRADRMIYYSYEEEGSCSTDQDMQMEDAKSQRAVSREQSETTETEDDEESETSSDVQSVTVPITVCLMIMVGYICFGGFLFCKWEDWKFLEAAYFCFISLSTIGFGDLVPGDKIIGHSDVDEVLVDEVFELRFVFCAAYLMLGMALIAMCFNLMQEEVIHKIRTAVRTFKYIFRCNR